MMRLIANIPERANCIKGLEAHRVKCAANLVNELARWTSVKDGLAEIIALHPSQPDRPINNLVPHFNAHNASFLSVLSVAAMHLGSDRGNSTITAQDIGTARCNVALANDIARNFLDVARTMFPLLE